MTTIKLKNGSGAPTAGDLVTAEPALDLTNKRLYTEDSGGTVIEVGTNPGTDVTFADNRKAVFGDGSDLQIYHDGSNSYIDDAGTGNLFVRADSLQLRRADGSQLYLAANTGAEVGLYHAGNAKLATTSTGIDVTGTMTADGLTVDGSSSGTLNNVNFLNTNSGATTTANRIGLGITNSAGAAYTYIEANESGVDAFPHLNFYTGNTATKRLEIEDNGDISFYEDTGTTAKLFWDASAESLGIGTSSPSHPLHLVAADGTLALFSNGVDADLNIKTASAVTLLTPSTGTLAFGTSNTERMRIDSSGNVGIGTSPSELLHLKSANPVIRLEDSNPDGIYAQIDGAGGSLILSADQGNGSANSNIVFKSDNTERMRIDSSGNVGINNSNPSAYGKFVVDGTGNILNVNATSGSALLQLYEGGSGRFGIQTLDGSAGAKFTTAGTERMRIDASGNLLVGKSGTALGTAGVELAQGGTAGKVWMTRSGDNPLLINRLSNDGSLVDFYKDGTSVGSIGADNASINIASGNTGLLFYDTATAIYPRTAAGAQSNGAIDLGGASDRFKDLYLSGGAYLGGTAAANKLDDYEEGTWSPQYTNTTPPTTPYTMDIVSADYVKIGNTVFITANIRTDSVNTSGALGALRISGLPFTCGSSLGIVSVSFAQNWGGDFPSSGYVNSSSTQIILLYRSSANGATFESNAADLTSGVTANQNQLIFSAIYTV